MTNEKNTNDLEGMPMGLTTVIVADQSRSKPGEWRFGVALFSLCLIGFTATLDGSILATALPRITEELETTTSSDYVWIANCFLLAQTCVQPPLAQICNIFGRRNPMIISLVLFAVGSGVAGGGNTATQLIAGRTVQGLGAGGIMLLIEMIVCDLVPMRERGKYLGIVLSVCSIGAVLGPVVGGAIAEADWRWIFYLNIPIAGVVLLIMISFLQLRYKKEPSWTRYLARVDWIGSILFIASICALLLGLVLGGSQFSWSSWRIILPIVLGVSGWITFHVYEASKFCKEPSVPPILFKNRTSSTGFVLVFISSVLLQWIAFFLPLYFQSVREATPLRSGINLLPFQAFLIPAAMAAGFVLTKTGSYKPLHCAGFALTAIGIGLLTLLKSDTHTAVWTVFQAIVAIGMGFIAPSLLPAIQASLQESEVATSTGVFSFLRSFGYTWGITIPGIIFNNRWDKLAGRISDPNVRAQMGHGMAYHFAGNMHRHPYQGSLRTEIINVYSETIKTVFIAAIPFAVVCFFLVFVEKRLKLREELETEFGLENGADTVNTKDKSEPLAAA